MKSVLFGLLTTFTTLLSLHAQENIDQQLNKFYQLYQENSSDAVDYLASKNILLEQSQEEIINLKYQLYEVYKVLGKVYEFEKLSEKKIGNHISRFVYMMHHELRPIRFIFTYYTINGKFIPLSFHYDMNYEFE